MLLFTPGMTVEAVLQAPVGRPNDRATADTNGIIPVACAIDVTTPNIDSGDRRQSDAGASQGVEDVAIVALCSPDMPGDDGSSAVHPSAEKNAE